MSASKSGLSSASPRVLAWPILLRRPRDVADETGDFDFLPDWFFQPLDAKLALQRGLAHTQMLCSFIHERRDADARAGAA